MGGSSLRSLARRIKTLTAEARGGPRTRRTRALRAIPETDPSFAVFAEREAVESAFADLKRQAGRRLHALRDDNVALSVLAYQALVLARVLHAHR